MKSKIVYAVIFMLTIAVVLGYRAWSTSVPVDPQPLGLGVPSVTTVPVGGMGDALSVGKIDECCFRGWAYDNDQPIVYSITLENMDYPGLTRSVVSSNTKGENGFVLMPGPDVKEYLKTRGAERFTHPLRFSSGEFVNQLYPGRYRIQSATYNGKPLDVSSLQNRRIQATWPGTYEARYSPVSGDYIQRDSDSEAEVLHEAATGKSFRIFPRPDAFATYHARWSPTGAYIAYASSQYEQGPLSFNVLTPGEVKRQTYDNPNRVLVGGDGILYEWLDAERVVLVGLQQKTDHDWLGHYKYASIQIYNASTDTFEHPMGGKYIENVHQASIAPDRKTFLFDTLSDVHDGNSHVYILTDHTGKELWRASSVPDNWYEQ